MRRRLLSRGRVAAGGAVLLVAALAFSITDRTMARTESPAPPAALARVGQKNDAAATVAAARMKERSEQAAEAADRMIEAQERGAASADATIARFENDERR